MGGAALARVCKSSGFTSSTTKQAKDEQKRRHWQREEVRLRPQGGSVLKRGACLRACGRGCRGSSSARRETMMETPTLWLPKETEAQSGESEPLATVTTSHQETEGRCGSILADQGHSGTFCRVLNVGRRREKQKHRSSTTSAPPSLRRGLPR